MLLSISEVEPARRTMALSFDPDDTSVALKPKARDSMAMKTPTVPAIPSTATTADDQRCLTLRKLYTTGIAISDPPQRVDYAQPHGADRRQNAAGRANRQRYPHANNDCAAWQIEERQQAASRVAAQSKELGEAKSQSTADDSYQQRFKKHKEKDEPIRVPDSLEHCELR